MKKHLANNDSMILQLSDAEVAEVGGSSLISDALWRACATASPINAAATYLAVAVFENGYDAAHNRAMRS